MHKRTRIFFLLLFLLAGCFFCTCLFAQKHIDRKALVERHKVINTKFDSLSSLTVGNGKFAFTVDVTGLQTFVANYQKGIPLGTESEWGWHSFIDTGGYKHEEALKEYDINGRKISYAVQWNEPERNKNASNWFRQNPHRLQLGNLGFELIKKDSSLALINDIKNINKVLNPWTKLST
jgi:protein-glucosylgalactosylhydroxylysine glucosidase